jgi:F-type H+-transporting ATPase subunit delta
LSAGAETANSAVGRVYADAVFAIAKESNAVDAFLEDLRVVLAAFRDNPKFEALYSSPKIAREETERMVRGAFEGKLRQPLLHLLLLLVRRGRQRALPAIVRAYEALVDADRNQRRVALATASPLDDALKARIADALSKKTGQKVLLDARVDPALLGGAVLRVGDTVVDGSLRTGLARLAKQMQEEPIQKGA